MIHIDSPRETAFSKYLCSLTQDRLRKRAREFSNPVRLEGIECTYDTIISKLSYSRRTHRISFQGMIEGKPAWFVVKSLVYNESQLFWRDVITDISQNYDTLYMEYKNVVTSERK